MTEFERLLLEHRGAAERLVRFKISSRTDADDLLQEVFLAAFEKFETLRDEKNFKPWLLSIARNKCRDYYRKKMDEREVSLETMESNALATGRFGLSEQSMVSTALDSLNAGDRQMIDLFFVGGYSQEEIARWLNIPVGTVKSRVFKARKHFKEAYAPELAKKDGAAAMKKKKLPEFLPEYSITPLTEEPFRVRVEELMGWFLIPRLGEKLTWGMYDLPSRKCSHVYDMEVVGRAVVHGIEGVEVTAREAEYSSRNESIKRTFVAQLTDTHCRYLAALRTEDGVRNYITFLDGEAFLANWGFGEDNCGNEVELAPKGDIVRTGDVVTYGEKEFLMDVVGRYAVSIGGKTYDTVCIMALEAANSGVISEQFVDQKGRTVLWRRYNRDDWEAERFGGPWSQQLPRNGRITVNDAVYVHWYDCITDYVL